MRNHANLDAATVDGFGEEWAAFDQEPLADTERQRLFEQYFALLPLDRLRDAEGFDLGCGSGRWALMVAPQVRKLHCIDPSPKALEVCRRKLAGIPNAQVHLAGAHDIPLPDGSQDFGYSLGVLHHIPDTEAALKQCIAKLRAGAPFLVYLYYTFDNRPAWFRALWRISDVGRRGISRLPFGLRRAAAEVIAAVVYFPLARLARSASRMGADVSHWPLSHYREVGFYTMRTDALDRFGTRLEHRFSRREIEAMMRRSGLADIRFAEGPPFWVAVGTKAGGE